MSGEQIFPSGVKTNDGGVAGLDPQLLQKVSDGTWEESSTGTVYFSPDQHGGIYGVVVRQYWSGANAYTGIGGSGTGVAISNYSALAAYGGYITHGTDGELGFPWHEGTAADDAYLDDGTFVIGSNFTGAYKVWVDYVDSTVTDKPSPKIMPTIDPTVLQRVDDMTFEGAPVLGGTTAITAFADGTGSVIVTAAGHGLSDGLQVEITGTTNYNGRFVIFAATTDTFKIDDTWVSDDATGTVTLSGSVEYFSPEQHGGSYGKIIRRYFYTKLPATGSPEVLIVDANIKKVLAGGGPLNDKDGADFSTPLGHYSSAASWGGFYYEETTSSELRLYLGSALYAADDIHNVWVDYNQVTPPTTRPTGQPFADPNSGLLKRVDTGRYGIPSSGVEYYSDRQRLGKGVAVYCQYALIAAPVNATWTSFVTGITGATDLRTVAAEMNFNNSGRSGNNQVVADSNNNDIQAIVGASGNTAIQYFAGAGVDDLEIWVHYTKV